jgi:hypothetical protein
MAFSIFPKKIDFFRLFLYLLFGGAAIFLYFVGDNGEPLSLALLYAMVGIGFAPIPSALLCALPALFNLQWLPVLLLLGQALFVAFGQYIQSKLPPSRFKSSGVVSLLTLSVALALSFIVICHNSLRKYSKLFTLNYNILQQKR